MYVYLCFVERNILYPLVFLAALTQDSPAIVLKFGSLGGALVVVVCGLKCIRGSYSDTSSQYLILVFAVLFFKLDYMSASETFLVDYFIMGIMYNKTYELLLKVSNPVFTHTELIILLSKYLFVGTICCDLHCTLANNLGFCVSCICATLLGATFGNVIFTSIHLSCPVNTIKSIFR